MNPLLFVALVVVALSAACMVIARIADDTYTPDQPDDALPAHARCAVTDCPREWATDRSGWRLCHKHYRELVTDRRDGAA